MAAQRCQPTSRRSSPIRHDHVPARSLSVDITDGSTTFTGTPALYLDGAPSRSLSPRRRRHDGIGAIYVIHGARQSFGGVGLQHLRRDIQQHLELQHPRHTPRRLYGNGRGHHQAGLPHPALPVLWWPNNSSSPTRSSGRWSNSRACTAPAMPICPPRPTAAILTLPTSSTSN